MTELYVRRHFWGRYLGLVAFLVLVFVYGCFELWRAWRMPSNDSSSGIMFGLIFAGGSLYGLRQVLEENRDLVVSLVRNDGSAELTASVFARFNVVEINAPSGAFTDWRLHRKPLGRNRAAYFVHATCSAWPRPLRFDLRPGTDLTGLRQLAPGAIAEFEAATPAAAKSGAGGA